MSEPDFDLNLGGHEPDLSGAGYPPYRPPVRQRSPIVLIGAVAAVVVIVAAAYFFLRGGTPDAAPTATTSTAAPVAPPAPLGGNGEPITEPLDQSDAVVRKLAAALSSHPRLAAWLATTGLIRNFVVVVENVSTGVTPAGHLRVLRPTGPFRVIENDEELRLDPRNYDRYTSFADAVASIDAAGAARVYSSLKVRMGEAYADLGREEPFDRALERAIVAMLEVPIVEGTVRLEPTGATQYRYADADLEELTPPQKQLLRMGPANVRVIQGKLREIALALGIPDNRLPR
jgi:hypothetical protein